MATLIAVYNSEKCIGRCDANCYAASAKRCSCICGGKNHGAGLMKAIRNNEDRVGLTLEDLERFAKDHDVAPDDLRVIDRCRVSSHRKALTLARSMFTAEISDDDLFAPKKELVE